MKTSPLVTSTMVALAIATGASLTGCSKRADTAASPETPPAPAAGTAQPSSSTPASQPAGGVADLVKATADGVKSDAQAMGAEVKAKSESVAEAAAAQIQQKSQTAPAAATATASETRSPALPANLNEAAAATGVSLDALKQQAEQLLSQYSGELTTLKDGAAKVKALIDQNAAMLPAGVQAKYQELDTLLPRLTSMVDSLKNYQTADLTTLVPKLKEDFAAAQKLYGEIKTLVPALQ